MPRKKTPFIQKKHSNTYSISAGHNDFIDEKYAVDKDAADKIISGMSQDWFDTIIG